MISVPFKHVTDDGKGLMLNSDLKITNVTKANLVNNADQIWVWIPDDNAYATFYINNSDQWVRKGTKTLFEETPGFENGLPEGAAIYYVANKNGNLPKMATGSGAVETEAEFENEDIALNNYTMMSSPYPTALFLNGKTLGSEKVFEVTNVTKANLVNNADQIWVWIPDDNAYATFYINNSDQWVRKGTKTLFEETPGFENGLAAGKAFYFVANKNGVLAKSIIFRRNF